MTDELRNPFTGQTLRFLAEDDEVLVMESTYEPGGASAPAHLHPAQIERFVVLSGAISTIVGGEERTVREGEELMIPPGTPHVFGGDPGHGGTVRWEVRPPLRTREFFIALFGALQAAADAQEQGTEPVATFDFADWTDVFRSA